MDKEHPTKGGTVVAPPQGQSQTPFFKAQAVATPVTDTDRRSYVDSARDYIRSAAQMFQVSKVDAATFERVLTGWLNMSANIESIIAQIQGNAGTPAQGAPSTGGPPAGDPVLLEDTRKDFSTAIRTLFVAAAAQLKKPLIRLYLENMYRLPAWAWPDSGLFTGGNEKDKRTFAGDFAKALADTALFGGYSKLDRAKLEEVLGRLNTLVDDAQVMIAGQLGNDNNLRHDLQTSYSSAVNTLLTRAAPTIGSSVFSLYTEYRYGAKTRLIHEWADEVFSGITAPLPMGTGGPDPLTGEVSFMLNGFKVIILPDGTKSDEGGVTSSDLKYLTPGSTNSGGKITGFDPLIPPTIRIQTKYGPGAGPGVSSGYGKGTTAGDKQHGDTTLGYHEGSHARDFLTSISARPAPAFGGTVGSTIKTFHGAIAAYQAALSAYMGTLNRGSELLTDCVGKPTIEEFYKADGKVSPVACP